MKYQAAAKYDLELAEAERNYRQRLDDDTATDGLGVAFRVANTRSSRLGRMTVFTDEFGFASKTTSRDVARWLANLVSGRVVPHDVAERMAIKKNRRSMGFRLAWILHDLPRRSRSR